MTSDVLVVTPWFPTPDRPYYGAFVREWVRALRLAGANPTVLHVDSDADFNGDIDGEMDGVPTVRVAARARPNPTRADQARAQARTIAEILPRRWPDVRAVHAHVTMPTGWAVAQALPPDARLVLTEHASYLNQLLRDPELSAMFAAAVERSTRLFTVSERIAAGLRARLPQLADRFVGIGNPVAFDRLPMHAGDRDPSLSRWLYLGNLIPQRKGVERVLDAFALAAEKDADVRLSIVGDGALRDELTTRVGTLGLTDRVEISPGVSPSEVPDVYTAHDMLVHLSMGETFGMTAVEAVASGLPAIVTMCGGPEETMPPSSGLGCAELIPLEPDAASVVAAWQRLRASYPYADWAASRRILEQRYSPESIGATVAAELLGDGQKPLVRQRLSVLVVAVDPRELKPVLDVLQPLGFDVRVRTLGRQRSRRSLAGVLQKTRAARRPRATAQAATQIIENERADVVLADSYVAAALTLRAPQGVEILSPRARRRLWQLVAEATSS